MKATTNEWRFLSQYRKYHLQDFSSCSIATINKCLNAEYRLPALSGNAFCDVTLTPFVPVQHCVCYINTMRVSCLEQKDRWPAPPAFSICEGGPLDHRSDGSRVPLMLGVRAWLDAPGYATYLLSGCCLFREGLTIRQQWIRL